ncbi:MAG: transglutaminase domain-containing protein, partial [Burkholderiaceae bacterium]|nr:transglutaminase domain-containing protein [Burkholderiaceae bacterium]
ANTTVKSTPTIKPTKKPAATATPTIKPTSKPTKAPTSTPVPATQAPSGSFPAKNYGTFFRDNYGQNSSITTSTADEGGISVDTGSTPYGVVLIRVDNIASDKRCKVIISAGGSSYQYDILDRGKYVGLPLQLGNGSYQLNVYEGLGGDSYSSKWGFTFSVSLASSLKPYTASSIMSDFSRGSGCVGKANNLCGGIDTSTGKVDAVYSWIINNISYDRALASSISNKQITTYVPDPDKTYSTRKGICFDYASLMCAMLRSQGIPTRLIVGPTSLGYHAWNEVFFEGKGWVVVASFEWQQIDGSGWVLFDSTFAAGGMSGSEIQGTTHTKQKTY